MANLNPGGGTAPLYLEDLRVGQRFVSGTYRLDEGQIRAFAAQFDPQPFHLDAEAAKATLFGGVVASGWHTAAITMRLLVKSGLPIAGGLIGAGGEITWPRPVRPGAVLHVESEILELRPSRSRPDRGVVTVRSETRDQPGEVVQVLVARLVVPRRMRPEAQGGQSSKESCTATGPETSPAPRPALTEPRLDALPGRRRIEASPGEEQVSRGEMG
jgi:acyl dehydratase